MLLTTAATLAADEPSERWSRYDGLELTGQEILGLGFARFPDGESGLWVGSTGGTWREIDGNWERWPIIEGRSPGVRALLVAPDEEGLTGWWLATVSGILIGGNDGRWQRMESPQGPFGDATVLVLHLVQTAGAGPEIWIGTSNGLAVRRGDDWEIVAARSDGFFGGQVHSIRELSVDDQRQLWVAGQAGISRVVDGRWQRWGRACLRGHTVNAFETLDHPQGLRLAVATDRGLVLLAPNDPEVCEPIEIGPGDSLNITHLARDRTEQLYLFSTGRVTRFSAHRHDSGVQMQWTFFDHRDGLAEGLSWTSASALASGDTLLAGSRDGLWRLATPDGRRSEALTLQFSDTSGEHQAGPGGLIQVDEATPQVLIEVSGSAREHALRYRYGVQGKIAGPWRSLQPVALETPDYGFYHVMIEIADAYGHIHGPFRITVERPRPWSHFMLGVLALVIVSGLIVQWMRRRVRSAS